MTTKPMTTFGGDGKALAPACSFGETDMTEFNADIEDVEQSETTEAVLEEESTDKVPSFEEEVRDLEETVEEAEPLPTPKEAELGELASTSERSLTDPVDWEHLEEVLLGNEGGQFEDCQLLEEGDSDLIEFITEGEEEDNDPLEGVSILEEIESEFDDLTGGEE